MSTQNGLRQTPPYTLLFIDSDGDPVEYRSVVHPARVSQTRRIDVSTFIDVVVSFVRLRSAPYGIDRTDMGAYFVAAGTPLMWPVPESSRLEDIFVLITPTHGDQYEVPVHCPVHIGDHWHTA